MDPVAPTLFDVDGPGLDATLADVPAEALLAPLLGGRRAAGLLVEVGGLRRLARMTPRELLRHLRPTEAVRLASAVELGRRCQQQPLETGRAVRGLRDVDEHLRGLLAHRLKEVFVVVLLDAKNRPMRTERVSEGCLTWSVVHPREVFAPAVRDAAGAVLVAHNHPSGDPTPSRQDIEVTGRLVSAGETLGIPLLDHVVVGAERSVSMRAEGLMDGR